MTAQLNGRQILVVSPGLETNVKIALQHASVRLAQVEQLEVAVKGAHHPDLLLIDADAVDMGRLLPCIEAMVRERRMPPLIVMGGRLPTRLVRAAMQAPCSDLLETPFAPEELVRMAEHLLTRSAPVEAEGSRCWTVMGAVGGCGATTLAAEIAASLAQGRSGGKRVCLVDLNLADGATSAYLGTAANMSLSHTASADRIDASVLEAFLSHADDGFDVLAAPRHPDAFSTVGAGVVTRVLDVACQAYDWVVVDLPRHRQPWTLDVIAGSDELFLISELTVPALLAARAQASEIEAHIPGGPRPRIVLNRVASRMFAAAPSFAEAQKALGRPAEMGIASDWEAAAASVNLGGVIRRHRPRSKIVRHVDELVLRLASLPRRSDANHTRAA